MSKKITLLGSTGSIGTQSLDVIRAQGYEVFGLSAHSHVDKILQQIEEKKERVKPKVVFEPGETVRITDGPFLSFGGIVEEVDPERGKLKVSVSIFGRTAPVELEYWQVERGE